MSQMPATTALRAPQRATRAAARPELRVVHTGATRVAAPPRRLPFVLFCSALLAAGLIALLFINMSLAKGAYALHDLQNRSQALEQDSQLLREQLAAAEAPARLAQAAREIGMVPGTAPVFLDVSDGSLTGEPTPAPTPTRSAGAEASASPTTVPTADTRATPQASASSAASDRSADAPSASPTPGGGN